jgi:hypothetical protein
MSTARNVTRVGLTRLSRDTLSIPATVYRFDSKAFNKGLETRLVGGMPVKIYSTARSVVDCFKFRNKIGLDVALEALRLARRRKRVQNKELLHYARLLCVENPMSPYLQAMESEGPRRLGVSTGGSRSPR